MLILDTDHMSEIQRGSSVGAKLMAQLKVCDQLATISIVSVEELLRGWLHLVRLASSDKALTSAYAQFQKCLTMLSNWTVLSWTDQASDVFNSLRTQKVRIATMDLRIASVAMAFDATLLRRNLVDFRQVAGLRVENWLE
jgi:tRNA(fMet)-specific endonuclease VapC